MDKKDIDTSWEYEMRRDSGSSVATPQKRLSQLLNPPHPFLLMASVSQTAKGEMSRGRVRSRMTGDRSDRQSADKRNHRRHLEESLEDYM